jgi:transcription antitermination factor NusG
MHWYAIRTKPGAQQPKREYWLEPSKSALDGHVRGKGYYLASSVNPALSAVEMALEEKGFTFYMPAEFTAVRNRNHKGLYEVRRFALMKGYMFVNDPDWSKLMSVPGVQGVVGNNGDPFPIRPMDLFRLRMYEANSKALAVSEAKSLSTAGERLTREQRKVIARSTRKKLHPGREVKLIWGNKVGREATVQAWEDQDHVRVLLQSLDAAAETIVVPFEHLKAAS